MTKMRITKWLILPALGATMTMSACGPGYATTGVGVEAQYGTGIDLYGYDSGRYGDWHANYRNWAPTTVYELNGTYYPRKVRGARQVQVYHSQNGYFLPPRDQEWSKTDRRFNQKRMPNDGDYGRARPRP
jgi:hypothetical protein